MDQRGNFEYKAVVLPRLQCPGCSPVHLGRYILGKEALVTAHTCAGERELTSRYLQREHLFAIDPESRTTKTCPFSNTYGAKSVQARGTLLPTYPLTTRGNLFSFLPTHNITSSRVLHASRSPHLSTHSRMLTPPATVICAAPAPPSCRVDTRASPAPSPRCTSSRRRGRTPWPTGP